MSPALEAIGARLVAGAALHPLAIAAVMIAATLFVTYYAFNQGLPFVHTFTLYAIVNNSVNVRAGLPVRIAGIDVGAVPASRRMGNATQDHVHRRGQRPADPSDATIRIRDRLFLEGGYYLDARPRQPERADRQGRRHDPRVADGEPGAVLQACSRRSTRRRATSLEQHAQHAQPGLQRPARSASVRQRRRRPEDGDPAAHAGAQGRRLGHPRAARHAGRRRRESAQLGLATSPPRWLATAPSSADLVTGLNTTSSALAASRRLARPDDHRARPDAAAWRPPR